MTLETTLQIDKLIEILKCMCYWQANTQEITPVSPNESPEWGIATSPTYTKILWWKYNNHLIYHDILWEGWGWPVFMHVTGAHGLVFISLSKYSFQIFFISFYYLNGCNLLKHGCNILKILTKFIPTSRINWYLYVYSISSLKVELARFILLLSIFW